ncbi:hypothetical protein CC2G_001924 [Coprinopsis cinerea AmutBmut pab1-1]|nr:hypothetical protein CC2G_001924 [Coprinopsis cinerea AmutBmut pab1-1]
MAEGLRAGKARLRQMLGLGPGENASSVYSYGRKIAVVVTRVVEMVSDDGRLQLLTPPPSSTSIPPQAAAHPDPNTEDTSSFATVNDAAQNVVATTRTLRTIIYSNESAGHAARKPWTCSCDYYDPDSDSDTPQNPLEARCSCGGTWRVQDPSSDSSDDDFEEDFSDIEDDDAPDVLPTTTLAIGAPLTNTGRRFFIR